LCLAELMEKDENDWFCIWRKNKTGYR
jgi:hypothetical protein